MEKNAGMRGTRVMLVEDDALLRVSLSIFFRTKGCSLLTFPDAETAMEALGTERLDVVISDHLLPGMDGLTFLKCVESLNPEAIRVLITAYPGGGLPVEAGRAGIDDFLQKPFTAETLERTVCGRLAGRRRGDRDRTKAEAECATPEPGKENQLR